MVLKNKQVSATAAQQPVEPPRNYRFQFEEQPLIIHRSQNRIIVAGDTKRFQKGQDAEPCGQKSPESQPYRPNGVLQRVVPVIEELKVQLENTLELSPDA